MNAWDQHDVVVDVHGDGTDVWVASWRRDGHVAVCRGDSMNNRTILQHMFKISWSPTEDISVAEQIREFCEYASGLLHDLTRKLDK